MNKRDLKHAASVEHPALFACIMRRAGASGALECHGFVCASKDDAVRVASDLYKALMETMNKQQDMEESQQQQQTKPSRPPRTGRKSKRDGGKRSSEESSQVSVKILTTKTCSMNEVVQGPFKERIFRRLR